MPQPQSPCKMRTKDGIYVVEQEYRRRSAWVQSPSHATIKTVPCHVFSLNSWSIKTAKSNSCKYWSRTTIKRVACSMKGPKTRWPSHCGGAIITSKIHCFTLVHMGNVTIGEFQQGGATWHGANETTKSLKRSFDSFVDFLAHAIYTAELFFCGVMWKFEKRILLENWASQLKFVRAERGGHLSEIIFET